MKQPPPTLPRKIPKGQVFRSEVATYEFLQQLGDGSFGETWKARVQEVTSSAGSPRPGDYVAFKLAKPPLESRSTPYLVRLRKISAAFNSEILALRRLESLSCVAHILDAGMVHREAPRDSPRSAQPTPIHFVVQEYVEGPTLDEYLATHTGNGTRFRGLSTSEEFFAWSRRLAADLLSIHQLQVVHGDIWPRNIIIDTAQAVRFIDFGNAVFRDLVRPPADYFSGPSHDYLPPERLTSLAGDIYSLGALLHYLASGAPPPQDVRSATDIDETKTIVAKSLRDFPSARQNGGTVDVVCRCLRRHPEDRVQHTLGLLQDIDLFSPPKVHDPIDDILPTSFEDSPRLFQDIAWQRLRRTKYVLQSMAQGVYDLVGDHEDIVTGMSQVLALLSQADQYLTASVPTFWFRDNLGVNGRFLTMNALAAQRGATIRRIFLLTAKELKRKKVQHVLAAHRAILRDLRQRGIPTRDPALAAGGYYAGYLEFESEYQRQEAHKKGGHFGLLLRPPAEAVALYPIYGRKGSLVAIRFRSTQDIVKTVRQRFESFLKRNLVALDD